MKTLQKILIGASLVGILSGCAEVPIPREPILKDFDNDGIEDMVYVNDGELYFRKGLEKATFGESRLIKKPRENELGWHYYTSISAVDIDKDGNLDLSCSVVLKALDGTTITPGGYDILRGDGKGVLN